MSNFDYKSLYFRGLELYKKNQLDNSLKFLMRIENKDLNTLKLLSQIHIKKKDFSIAKTILIEILRLDKKNLFALNNLGDLSKIERNFEDAEKYYQKSISYDGNLISSYFNLASLYEDKGKLDLAKKNYLKVIEFDDKNYAAFFNLQRLQENLITEEMIKRIDDDLKTNQNSKSKIIAYGHFVIAKNYRKKNEIKKELIELSKGHKIFFNSDPINKEAVNYWLVTVPKMLEKNFQFENKEKNEINSNNIEPIFIFGIPRSGTTLVETIITSGDENIYNAGENFILQKALQKTIINKKLQETGKTIKIDFNFLKKNIINSYTKKFSAQTEKLKFIDRTMTNFFFSEILLEVFPNAKIINCKRDNFHNLIAIYQQCLNNLPWSHDVKYIKKYISIYNFILKNLNKNYSKKILNIELKTLTEFPEETSKKIMSFCNLKWSDKVLKFYERKDLICTTASNIQIRKKIYKYDSTKFLPYKEYFDNF